MLTVFRRHTRKCPHRKEGRSWRKCGCPLAVKGKVNRKLIRQSLGTRAWEVAQQMARDLETEALFPKEEKPNAVTVKKSVERFFEDLRARHLAPATIQKYEFLLNKQLIPFLEKKRIRKLEDIDPEMMRIFRATWKDGPLAGYKKLERLRSAFRFFVDCKYMPESPVARIRPPKVKSTKIQVFSPEEMERIMWALELYPKKGIYRDGNAKRLKAFVLVLRYTGLRIGDVVSLEKDRVKDGMVFLYTSKAGTPVRLPLPEGVVESLNGTPDLGRFYFWSGNGELRSAVSDWQRSLRKLFALAGVKGNPHMFRHSFATELLTKGVSLETVAALLGNTPAIVQKHYSHFVKEWQIRLEADVRKIWN